MRYVAIRSEGGLLPYDLLDKIVADQVAGQKPADFGLGKGQRLIDEVSRVWADAQNLWSNFKRRRQSLTERDPYGTSITRSWIVSLLSDPEMLGFDLKLQASAVVVNNVTFAISHRNGGGEDAIPVHIEGCKIDLDRRLHTKLRTSPRAMLQDFLNNSEQSSWGILTNGVTLRLLRDSSRTSRPTYLEFDLESMLEGNRFNEFALFYRLCHRSRFPRPGQEPSDCLLERYYLDSIEQGLRVRDNLRDGVEEALKILGSAFLQHPVNEKLRTDYAAGKLTPEVFHRQLLLLVYRLLFLMVAEERGLIVSLGEHADRNQKIYDEWYSVTRLRERAARIVEASPFGDLWIGLKETFSLFEYGLDTNALGIPPLNGDLFNENRAIPDLAIAEVYNHELLVAVRHLSLFKTGSSYQRVNYSGLDVEELGSVYESLLDYKPVVTQAERGLTFDLRTGTERKSTGSYYTRPELVHELVESALVPVMENRIAAAEKATTGKNLIEERNEKIKAILSLAVCDPACGSGHFLLAAARRLGKELARVRTGEDEPRPEDFHLAVRDVISHCIYGVDVNPLAVDLCKLALWLEGHWAGKPLSFLDHRIRCGNSLIGVLDPEILEDGIPDEAFTAVTGDDKKVAAFFKKRNKQDRTSRGFAFEPEEHSAEYASSNRELRELAENTAADVRKKAQIYSSWRAGMQHSHDETVADLWTAQFFLPLTSTADPVVCTTKEFLEFAVDKRKKPQLVAAAQEIAQQVRFFHWHLEFPEVFAKGGFDLLLGNPPWEKIQVEEQPFFAERNTFIAVATGSKRKDMIRDLELHNPSLFEDFQRHRRSIELIDKFLKTSSRFPLTGAGKMNTYASFAELSRSLLSSHGRAGILVPLGIATDDNNKELFAQLVSSDELVSLFAFENEEFLFPAVHHAFKFAALTFAGKEAASETKEFAFYCRKLSDLQNPNRRYALTHADVIAVNPNTLTSPIFRTSADALLNRRTYSSVGILIDDRTNENPWKASIHRMFNPTDDSALFRSRRQLEDLAATRSGNTYDSEGVIFVPVYEAKMMHQFDHRFGTYDGQTQEQANQGKLPEFSEDQHRDPQLLPSPSVWVEQKIAEEFISTHSGRQWLLAYRDITSSVVLRTAIGAILPRTAAVDPCRIVYFDDEIPASSILCFLSLFNSLIFDYFVRQKVSGSHLAIFVFKQLPMLPLSRLGEEDVRFITPRALELTFTAHDLLALGHDVWRCCGPDLRKDIVAQYRANGAKGHYVTLLTESIANAELSLEPFVWQKERRIRLRAELDAYCAHLYGFTREEVRYVLDPKDVFGGDFPSETFRVLQDREIKEHGEYRTRRLVLEEFDKLAETDRFRNEMPLRKSAFDVPSERTLVAVQ